jgi:hypothetical protein
VILPALLLFLAQDVPAPAGDGDAQGEEIVVTATLGRTTMLFDKGADGRLRNCRIMVSSGSQQRDTAACQATPVCYARTTQAAGECVELVLVEPAAVGAARPPVFDVPRLVQPKPQAPASALGPVTNEEPSRETEAQRVKLPPLPQAPRGKSAVTFSVGTGRQEDRK